MFATNWTIETYRAGSAGVVQGGREIFSLHRIEDNDCPGVGEWFALNSPSHADAYVYQSDQVMHAVAFGRTRHECAEAAMATLA